MALGLDMHGFADRLLQLFEVAGVAAHHVTEVYRVFLAQAQQQPPLGGHAHAVAAFAEVVRMRRDEAYPGAVGRQAEVARRAAGGLRGWHQLEGAFQVGADLVRGVHGLGAVVIDFNLL